MVVIYKCSKILACLGLRLDIIIVPGLSVRSLRGGGKSLALMYKCFAKDYRVYLFNRRHDVSEGFSIWDQIMPLIV